jgi:hypothetical protein
MKKRVFLIIESKFPTIHDNEKEARNYVTFVRNTDKQHQKLKALYCLYSDKDLSEGFANCNFKSI